MRMTTLNAAYKAVSEFTTMPGYYSKFEEINGLNFAMVCNNHIAQRAGQRMDYQNTDIEKNIFFQKSLNS